MDARHGIEIALTQSIYLGTITAIKIEGLPTEKRGVHSHVGSVTQMSYSDTCSLRNAVF